MRTYSTRKYLLSAFLFLLTISLSAQNAWKPVTSPVSTNLNSNDFANNSVGFITGNTGTIIKTINGGITWSTQNSTTTQNLYAVDAASATVAYIAGASGKILKTTNGGTIWTSPVSGTTADLFAIYFQTDSIGFAGGNGGTILKTVNAALNWIPLTSNTSQNLKSIVFPTSNTGYACGDNGTILKTSDAGANWTVLNSTVAANLADIAFTDSLTGYACGATGTLIKTIDGGLNWTQLALPATVDFRSVAFFSASQGLITGQNEFCFRTDDGGLNWMIMPGTIGDVNTCCFTSATTAVAAADSGKIFTSTTAAWNNFQNSQGTYPHIMDLCFRNASYGAGAGGNKVIMTRDGLHWSTSIMSGNPNLISIDFPTDSVGYTCSDNGRVYKTTNAGLSWTQISSISSSFNGTWIHFLNNDTGFYCTNTLRRTLDGGLTWDTVNLPHGFPPITRIRHTSEDTLFGITNSGMLRSTDGGNSWDLVLDEVSSFFFKDVWFPNPNTGYFLNPSFIYKTTDAGENWYKIYTFSAGTYEGICFVNSDTGYVVGKLNSLQPRAMKTTDGGLTWTVQTLGTNYGELKCVSFPDSRNGFAGSLSTDPIIPVLSLHTTDPPDQYSANTLTTQYSRAPFPGWNWVRHVPEMISNHRLYSFALDPNTGRTAAGGDYSVAILLGNTSYTCGQGNSYIATYDSTGNFLWGKNICSGVSCRVTALKFGPSGNLYACGVFTSTITIDNVTLTGNCSQNAFLACFDPTGTLLWIRPTAGTPSDTHYAYSVDCDQYENIYMSGSHLGTTMFFTPTDSIVNTGGAPGYIVSFNSSGNLNWANAYTWQFYNSHIATDRFGNLYSTGYFSYSIVFDNQTYYGYPNNNYDIYVTKIRASDGSFVWGKTYGGPGDDYGNAISTDSSGNVYIGGSIEDYVYFDNKWYSAVSKEDLFVASIDSSGIQQWVYNDGGMGRESVRSLACGPDNKIYFGGQNDEITRFADSSYLCPTEWNFHLGCLNQNGELSWFKTEGPVASPFGDQYPFVMTLGIGLDRDTNVYIGAAAADATDIYNELVFYSFIGKVGDVQPIITSYSYVLPENSFNILLYPNPASSALTIQLNGQNDNQKLHYSIVDSYGKLVKQDAFGNSEKLILDISNYAPGVYVISVENDQTNWRGRFVKQ